MAQAAGSAISDRVKNCNFVIRLKSFSDYTFAVDSMGYRVQGILFDKGVSFSATTQYYFANPATAMNARIDYTETRGGGLMSSANTQITVPAANRIWASCQGNDAFAANSQWMISSSNNSANAAFSPNSTPNLEQWVTFVWKKCRFVSASRPP